MNQLLAFYQSTIGKKILMALTGLALFGFLAGHLAGNFLVFQGADAFNAYAAFLKSKPGPLWVARLGLLACLGVHVLMSVQLAMTSWSARPQGYAGQQFTAADYASRTMRWTGPLVGLFVLYHLAHYTLHLTNPEFAVLQTADNHHDAYRMVIAGFSSPLVAGLYMAAMALLSFHLFHGLWSLFQTLGLNHPAYNAARRYAAAAIALGIGIGFLSIPLAVLTGVVR